jgi:ribosome recycling factor
MEKAIAKLKDDLTGIRTGQASPGLVDTLRVMDLMALFAVTWKLHE